VPSLDGASLVPLLRDPLRAWNQPALTTHGLGNHALRNERWRYIRYADGSEELYDMQADPNEWKNLAGDVQFADVKRDLAKWLPKVSAKPAPGSAHRILTYDPVTGEVNWEGQAVGKDEPIPD
jgi:arylsulfatase A-like enzyme